jgi:hypothetical protein
MAAKSGNGKASSVRGIEKRIEGLIDPSSAGDSFELMSEAIDDAAWVDFTEIRPALEPRQYEIVAETWGVGLTPREIDMVSAVGHRDYDQFYLRFKQCVFAGLWGYLLRKATADMSRLSGRSPRQELQIDA